VHIENVEYLLTHGMFTKNHAQADPDYINIGDTGLIAQRNDYPVGIHPPNGVVGDYVPFYFGTLSPMLLNIKTGYRGITQRPQSDIVYVVCGVSTLVDNCEGGVLRMVTPKMQLQHFTITWIIWIKWIGIW